MQAGNIIAKSFIPYRQVQSSSCNGVTRNDGVTFSIRSHHASCLPHLQVALNLNLKFPSSGLRLQTLRPASQLVTWPLWPLLMLNDYSIKQYLVCRNRTRVRCQLTVLFRLPRSTSAPSIRPGSCVISVHPSLLSISNSANCLARPLICCLLLLDDVRVDDFRLLGVGLRIARSCRG